MKAMVLKARGLLCLEEVQQPVPTQDQILVRVTHTGICGTDLKIYSGAIAVRHPLIMGHEMAGTVEADGSRVVVDPSICCGTCFYCRLGQTSLCPHGGLLGRDADGGFAEYVAVPRSQVFFLPDAIDNCQAPLLQVASTCLHAQRRVEIFPGQCVVVLGLGVTGQLHLQMAKARGAFPLIGITRSAWKRRLAEKLGADVVMAPSAEAKKDILDDTDGRGADLVIECTGKIPSIGDAISMARPGGTLLLFGITTATEGALPFYQLYFKQLTIVNSRAARSQDFPAVIDLVARGSLKLQPLVSHVISLWELPKAIQMLESDNEERMKIILDHGR